MPNLGWTVASAGAAMTAAFTAERLISLVWRGVTGHKPPADAENPDNKLGEAVAFAVVSGALIGLARVFATRGAARIYAKQVGGPMPWQKKDAVK